MSLNKMEINIYGQKYALQTSAEPKIIREIEAYINDKMKEVEAAGVDTSSQLRIAILATMNITGELLECKKKKDEVIDKVEARALAISEFIEDKISDMESSN